MMEGIKYSEYDLDGRRNFPLKKSEVKRTTYFGNWGTGGSVSNDVMEEEDESPELSPFRLYSTSKKNLK